MRNSARDRGLRTPLVPALDVVAKVVLLALVMLVVLDPTWGHLEGKAPTARALSYPMLAFAVPMWWGLRRSDEPYPWLPDLLLTCIAFSDILGNRLDLYDQVVWFDDLVHLGLTMCVSAALVLLTLRRTVSALAVLERSVALGMSAALGWEVFEYLTFVSQSAERSSAYPDTIGDLGLGFLGTVLAAGLVHTVWRRHLLVPDATRSSRVGGPSESEPLTLKA